MRDTKVCRFCKSPIVVMCQQGSGYCCQNHEDGVNIPPRLSVGGVIPFQGWTLV